MVLFVDMHKTTILKNLLSIDQSPIRSPKTLLDLYIMEQGDDKFENHDIQSLGCLRTFVQPDGDAKYSWLFACSENAPRNLLLPGAPSSLTPSTALPTHFRKPFLKPCPYHRLQSLLSAKTVLHMFYNFRKLQLSIFDFKKAIVHDDRAQPMRCRPRGSVGGFHERLVGCAMAEIRGEHNIDPWRLISHIQACFPGATLLS